MTYAAYGINSRTVLNCLSRYPFGELTEIVQDITFHKGIYTFMFKSPPGFKSWRQWLYLTDHYSDMSELLRALHRADDMETTHEFLDQNNNPFAEIGSDGTRYVHYLK